MVKSSTDGLSVGPVLERFVATPTRVYVGVLVFGLITAMLTLTYTALVLGGYRQPPQPEAPYQVLFPPQGTEVAVGETLFLIIASLFSLALTVWAWRSLVEGARRDAKRRRKQAEIRAMLSRLERQQGAGQRSSESPTRSGPKGGKGAE